VGLVVEFWWAFWEAFVATLLFFIVLVGWAFATLAMLFYPSVWLDRLTAKVSRPSPPADRDPAPPRP
jgi:hypothetical protein